MIHHSLGALLHREPERLPQTEKRLLQSAASIGMEVAVPLLQAVTDLAAAEIHAHLSHLQTAEFLYETGRLPASVYTFKHALTYEVAHGSLRQERRQVLPGRAAQAIEEFFAERLPEHYYALAYHYSRSGNTTRAVDYLQRAGQQAVERSAYAEAISHLTTALDMLTPLPETRERSQQELGVLMTLGALAKALATLDQSDMRLWEAEIYRLRGELLLQQTVTQADEAAGCFEQALAVARRQQARSWELRTAMSLARLWQQQGKCAEARELLAVIYGWFTKGFDTADLQEARALLQKLRA